VLEPALDHLDLTLRFHAQHDVDEARGDRRSEEPRALDGRQGRWKTVEVPRQHVLGQLTRLIETIGRHRSVSPVLPRAVERLKYFVNQPAALEWRQAVFFFALLPELEDITCVELERTLAVQVQRADRPGTRDGRVRVAVKLTLSEIGP
jgi:hypothetical protein